MPCVCRYMHQVNCLADERRRARIGRSPKPDEIKGNKARGMAPVQQPIEPRHTRCIGADNLTLDDCVRDLQRGGNSCTEFIKDVGGASPLRHNPSSFSAPPVVERDTHHQPSAIRPTQAARNVKLPAQVMAYKHRRGVHSCPPALREIHNLSERSALRKRLPRLRSQRHCHRRVIRLTNKGHTHSNTAPRVGQLTAET
jgi:hypothetical protein